MSMFPQRRCVSILGLIVTGSAAAFLACSIWAAYASVMAPAQEPPPATGNVGQPPASTDQTAERTDIRGEQAMALPASSVGRRSFSCIDLAQHSNATLASGNGHLDPDKNLVQLPLGE